MRRPEVVPITVDGDHFGQVYDGYRQASKGHRVRKIIIRPLKGDLV